MGRHESAIRAVAGAAFRWAPQQETRAPYWLQNPETGALVHIAEPWPWEGRSHLIGRRWDRISGVWTVGQHLPEPWRTVEIGRAGQTWQTWRDLEELTGTPGPAWRLAVQAVDPHLFRRAEYVSIVKTGRIVMANLRACPLK